MEDWQQWRKQERERIITTRMSTPTTLHQQWSVAISKLLQQGFPNLQQTKIYVNILTVIYCWFGIRNTFFI